MSNYKIIDEETVMSIIPPRRKNSRKGENGVVLVVGGSWMYHGAPFLTAMAAYRSGVDLTYLAVPEPLVDPIRAMSPAIIIIPLPDYRLTKRSVNKLLKKLPQINAAAIGPGLSIAKEEALTELVKQLLSLGAGVVLDASALIPSVLKVIQGEKVILTPHAGEFKRLFGQQPPQDLDEKISLATEKAKEYNVTILLKGPTDIITDGNEIYINKTGNAGMTVGGTGDVLTGITAGLLTRIQSPIKCAAAAAYINGKCGDTAYQHLGLHMLPTDIIDQIPKIMKPMDKLIEE
ncbi:MAG: NAD(P)H-hydrate dehydratase [Nitrososphaerota archaeon]